MENVYIFIPVDNLEYVKKYGIKLSENINKILSTSETKKKGIISYLSPRDSDLYNDENYVCLRISTNNLNIIIYNNICENTDFFDDFICTFDKYILGMYEEPISLICSSILPENIFIYDKIKDLPLLIENSKDFFYDKSINYIMDSQKFTKFELYQILLLLCEQKKLFKVENVGNKVKIYKDLISGKRYTKKSNV